jgi:hypothetical protein
MNSNKREFLKTLQDMKGKTFNYANKMLKIENFSIDDHREKVTIVTDKRTFERQYDSVEEFLTYWQPVGIEEAEVEVINETPNNHVEKAVITTGTNEIQNAGIYEEQASLAKDLISILRENITKVQNSKEYIPQATAINNNINSIINITKMQLGFYKQLKNKKSA